MPIKRAKKGDFFGWIGDRWNDISGATDRTAADEARTAALAQMRDMPGPERVRSEMSGAQPDPAALAMQRDVLARYGDLLNQHGMTAEDRAVASELSRGIESDASGAQQAALANAQSRGMGGSGLEFTAALSGGQAGANRANQFGMDQAAQAQRRYLQALGDSGNFGSQLRGQSYTEAASRAQANDTANRFNADLANSSNQFRYGNTANILTGNATAQENRGNHSGDTAKDVGAAAVQIGATLYGQPAAGAAGAKAISGSKGKQDATGSQKQGLDVGGEGTPIAKTAPQVSINPSTGLRSDLYDPGQFLSQYFKRYT